MSRSNNGTSAVEMPVAVLFLFTFLLLPFVDVATIAIRTSMVYTAAHNAMQAARKAQSFSADGNTKEGPSAVSVARRFAGNARDFGLKGVRFNDDNVIVHIVGLPTKPDVEPINSLTPLTELREQDYLYQVDVVVNAQIEPLIMLNEKLFGTIQGLTAPIPVTAEFKGFVERPAGLVK